MSEGMRMRRRHGAWWQNLPLLFTIHCSLFTISCTQDAYDKGEGKYSLMRGDFVEAHANGQKQIDFFLTDDGDRFTMKNTVSPKWVTTADSTYRCILYYNKVEEEPGKTFAEAISIGQVPCPRIIPLAELDKEMKTDPVRFESAWVSKSAKYLNLSLYVMTGTTDDEEASQKLSVVRDTLMTNPDNTRACHLRLFHDQGGIPEYYSSQVYVSIRLDSIDADSVIMNINTYKGKISKSFKIH